jgi:hypothetical protein
METLKSIGTWISDVWTATPYKAHVIVFGVGFVLGAVVF